MMELFDGLISRRSIRKYTGKKLLKKDLMDILKAGMYAPSARNKQPWHFIVIDKPEVLEQIQDVHPYASMLPEAGQAIVVCGDTKLQNGPGYWVVDCSAATQNILLAAHSKGLGAVWLGVHPRKERSQAIESLLELPEHIKVLSIIALGYPAEKKDLPERFNEERIYFNTWK